MLSGSKRKAQKSRPAPRRTAKRRAAAKPQINNTNDADVPADEIIAAVCAHSDGDHADHEDPDGWRWDPSRPVAGQWPGSDVEPHPEPTGPTDQGQPTNAFEPADSASVEPWADPSASTRLTDAELVETVAYCPPGSVRDDEVRCCPREAWGDGTHDLDCPQGGRP